MWLMENWSEVDHYNIEIVGSDIDTRVRSRRPPKAIYGERALMRLSQDVDRALFRADRGRPVPNRPRPAEFDPVHPRQSHRSRRRWRATATSISYSAGTC